MPKPALIKTGDTLRCVTSIHSMNIKQGDKVVVSSLASKGLKSYITLRDFPSRLTVNLGNFEPWVR